MQRAPSRQPPSAMAFVALSVVAHAALIGAGAGRGADPRTRRAPEARPETNGDTFEIPTEDVDSTESHAGANAGERAAASLPAPPHPVAPPRDPSRATTAAAPPARAARASSGVAARPGSADDEAPRATALFGAVGERSAAPLAATFTRGFPQAASADPLWLTAPFGSAGTVDVDLTIDEQGALVDAHQSGGASPALAEGVRRTLALVRARSFVATGRVTRLRVSATVTADEVHDGLHGDVFAIGGTFDEGEGNGFFALAIGRRVDIRVRVLR